MHELILYIYKKQWRYLHKYPDFSVEGGQSSIEGYNNWLSLKGDKPNVVRKDMFYMTYIYFPIIVFFLHAITFFIKLFTPFRHIKYIENIYYFAANNLNQGSASLLFSVLAFLMAFITLPIIYAINYKDKLPDLRDDPTSNVGKEEYYLRSFHTSRALVQLAAGICSLSIATTVAVFLITVEGILFDIFVNELVKLLEVLCFYFICAISLHSFLSAASATLELVNEKI